MPEALTITVQATPNPNAAKFTLNRTVASTGTTYRLPSVPGAGQAGDAAGADVEWAKRLLGVPGVVQLFALNNFLSVTKRPDAEWNVLGPQIEQILRESFV